MYSLVALSVLGNIIFSGVTNAANATSDPAMNSQIRLAYAGSTGMFVSWNTFEQISNPTVRYGLSGNSLNMSASSNVSITYPTSLTYNNHVKLSNLQPDTVYYYAPQHLVNTTYTAPLTFKTSRNAGTSKEFSVAVVVDMGTMGSKGLTTSAGKGVSPSNILQPGEINTIESLTNHADAFDFIWHPGDIAYADYWLKEEIQGFLPNTTIAEGIKVYESVLNEYYNELAAVSAFKPYMVGPGNHESNCDNGGTTDKRYNYTYTSDICMPGQTNFTGYKNHFRMPSAESGGTGNFWYSFNHGMTHFIQLDTETDLGHGFIGPDEVGGSEGQGSGPFNITMDAQTTWLEADLKAVNRSATPWVVVAGHRPWYLSHTNNSGTICWTCKDVFEPLLIKYNVDLVLSGHSHVYERQAPLADGVIDKAELNNPKSPWYITNGMGGHYDGLDALQDPRQKYSRYGLDTSNATYAWSKLTFHNCTHMSHDLIASKNGSVVDHATLFKNRTCTSKSGLNPLLTSTNAAHTQTISIVAVLSSALITLVALL